MHRLFISDLHLSDQAPSIETGLNDLITRERGVESLVILGDFFEAWVGDDDDDPLALRVKNLLRRLSLAGCEILVCRGNRDFMLGEQFAADISGTLLDDVTAMEVAGAPALVLHGDTLCTDDADYQQFRSLVHSRDWQAEMMEKPLAERRELASQLRALSIDAASNKPEDIMDVNDQAVTDLMSDHGISRMIHGHTHRPARHKVEAGERIVLGDWTAQQGWLLRENGRALTLEQFALS
ncbi:UDP-2,3-diacylglucosamine diphosphatase [Luminiphilus sp.]|nr:UDP-2,3-diacylglucosamine diphosphatase [Luminiphilus sp.]